jgi:hypothetical protein
MDARTAASAPQCVAWVTLLVAFRGALDLFAAALDVLACALHRIAAGREERQQASRYECAKHDDLL